ncbi:hypothetical protein GCM10010921_01650 [Microbacterium album]|uniref:Uncharacterized protein n=1 Tax=Microbacterium album TaxID=2053191 RepID=A0A917IC71_9MICO|nr:hypothetical protein GCM10010921_01650 [Microbacterium album]
MIKRHAYSPENGRLVAAITGPGSIEGQGLKRLLTRDPVYVIAGRWLVGIGPCPDREGRARTRRRNGHRELVTRPRVFRVPKDHPWRAKRP